MFGPLPPRRPKPEAKTTHVSPVRAFLASLSLSLLALTLSYQAAAIPAAFAPPPPPPPKSDAWIANAEAVPAKGRTHDDMSQLAPLL
ncbi:MAG: hypothetical protein ACJ8ER_14190 [Allosphingosinicella sp.]